MKTTNASNKGKKIYMNPPACLPGYEMPPDHEYNDDNRLLFFFSHFTMSAMVYVWYTFWLLMLAVSRGWLRPEFLGLKP